MRKRALVPRRAPTKNIISTTVNESGQDVLLTTPKLRPSLLFGNRLDRFCWTCANADMTASFCRMAGSEIKLLCTSGTQAEDTRLENMPRTATTETRLESCARCRGHHILICGVVPSKEQNMLRILEQYKKVGKVSPIVSDLRSGISIRRSGVVLK